MNPETKSPQQPDDAALDYPGRQQEQLGSRAQYLGDGKILKDPKLTPDGAAAAPESEQGAGGVKG